jgi:hypothetical protein
MTITAPDATIAEPLVLVFVLDVSHIPAGQSADTLAVFRNGAYVLACTGAAGEADPDPCVSDRQTLPDGDAQITVLTSQASDWNLGLAAPVAEAGGPYTLVEGSSVQLDASGSTGVDPLSYLWSPDISLDDATLARPTYAGLDDSTEQLTVQVTDATGMASSASAAVTVTNADPVAQVTGPGPIPSGTTVPLAASFTDAGTLDTHTASIDWGDGTVTPGVVVEANGSGTVVGSHRYVLPGTYSIRVKVTDDDGGIGNATSASFAVTRVPVTIDVTPGDTRHTVQLKSKQLTVAIYSTATFDAPTRIVKNSLTFGRMGTEASLQLDKGVPSCSTPDVNRDGRKDLQCNFVTNLTGLRPTDTQVILRALTPDGVYLEGRGPVRVVK